MVQACFIKMEFIIGMEKIKSLQQEGMMFGHGGFASIHQLTW